MKVSDLKDLEGFSLINEGVNTQKEIKGCYISDLLSWVMGHAKQDDAWITIMSHLNIIAVASLLELSCIIIAEGEMPDEETINKATENDVALVSYAHTAFDAAKILIAGNVQ